MELLSLLFNLIFGYSLFFIGNIILLFVIISLIVSLFTNDSVNEILKIKCDIDYLIVYGSSIYAILLDYCVFFKNIDIMNIFDILFKDNNEKNENKNINENIRNRFNSELQKEVNNLIGNNNFTNEELKSITKFYSQNILSDENIMKDIYKDTNIDYKKIMDDYEIKEEKRLKNHVAFEGRLTNSDKNNLKEILGYRCMCCGINLSDIYGKLGNKYIELHHLIPYSELGENETRILKPDDFVVLCPNCHRMIHRLDNAGDIDLLRKIIRK